MSGPTFVHKTNPPVLDTEIWAEAPADLTPSRIGLQDFWHILRRNRLYVATIVILGMIAASAVILNLEKRYVARATIVLKLTDAKVELLVAQLELTELTRAAVETQIDVLTSREFAGQVASRLNLFRNPAFNPALEIKKVSPLADLDTAVRDRLGIPAKTPPPVLSDAEQQEAVITKLLSTYRVTRSGESLALDITVNFTDPETTAEIANTIAQEYIAQSLNLQIDAVNKSIAFLQKRANEIGKNLSLGETDYASFVRKNRLDDTELSAEMRASIESLASIVELSRGDPGRTEEVARMKRELTDLRKRLQERTRSELELLQMQRALETERNRYQSVTERLNEIESQVEILTPSARQVSVAEIARTPAAPNVKSALAISFVIILVLALVAMLIKEGLDRRIWNEEHTARVTGAPNLGYVPRVKKNLLGRSDAPYNFLRDKPHSAFSEALKALFTLCMNMSTAKDPKVIMVTAGLPDEGKSTIAVSLACAAAAENMLVLLVDFDIHRRGLSHMLNLPEPDHSFNDLLSDWSLTGKLIASDVEMQGLDVMSFKRGSVFPSQLNLDSKFQKVLRLLRKEYDVIIFDTPPILIVNDANKLAPVADEAILVAHWGKTTEESLRDAADLMRRNGIPLTGTVINGVDAAKQRKYGYGGYASYYAYGDKYYR